MKKTLILVALVAASYASNTSIKHRLGQVKSKTLAQTGAQQVDCPCNPDENQAPTPGQGVFNGWGQSAQV